MKVKGVGQAVLVLLLFGMCVAASAFLSTWVVVWNLSAALKAKTPAATVENPAASESEQRTVEIDFYAASGITIDEMREHVAQAMEREQSNSVLLLLSFLNDAGDCLTDDSLTLKWESGQIQRDVGRSGVVQVILTEDMLAGLKAIVPVGYGQLRQSSVPLGSVFDPIVKLNSSNAPYQVHYDGEIQTTIQRGLKQLQTADEVMSSDEFQKQMRSDGCTLTPESPGEQKLDPQQVYERRRDSVVVIAHLFPDGSATHATGFVIDSSGVVVTNYHVVNKPAAVSRGVMTSDRRMHRITRVLAADKAADLAILQIDASHLTAAPLADGDREGSPITLISHPNSRFYSLSTGHITRYWATVMYGRETHRLGVTADFSSGSSGAPVFNSRGNVTGIVTATEDLGYQMVLRMATPVSALKRLIRTPAAQVVLSD